MTNLTTFLGEMPEEDTTQATEQAPSQAPQQAPQQVTKQVATPAPAQPTNPFANIRPREGVVPEEVSGFDLVVGAARTDSTVGQLANFLGDSTQAIFTYDSDFVPSSRPELLVGVPDKHTSYMLEAISAEDMQNRRDNIQTDIDNLSMLQDAGGSGTLAQIAVGAAESLIPLSWASKASKGAMALKAATAKVSSRKVAVTLSDARKRGSLNTVGNLTSRARVLTDAVTQPVKLGLANVAYTSTGAGLSEVREYTAEEFAFEFALGGIFGLKDSYTLTRNFKNLRDEDFLGKVVAGDSRAVKDVNNLLRHYEVHVPTGGGLTGKVNHQTIDLMRQSVSKGNRLKQRNVSEAEYVSTTLDNAASLVTRTRKHNTATQRAGGLTSKPDSIRAWAKHDSRDKIMSKVSKDLESLRVITKQLSGDDANLLRTLNKFKSPYKDVQNIVGEMTDTLKHRRLMDEELAEFRLRDAVARDQTLSDAMHGHYLTDHTYKDPRLVGDSTQPC